jgi:hypothetical protein
MRLRPFVDKGRKRFERRTFASSMSVQCRRPGGGLTEAPSGGAFDFEHHNHHRR